MLELLGTGGLGPLGQALRDYGSVFLTLGAVISLIFLVPRLVAGVGQASGRGEPGFLARMAVAVVEAFTVNWQLTLLATTALVLSLASGWTTWDGMRNFTGEPILSLMVTFGIQGVMLIIAWLIGESFASGMNQRTSRGRSGDAPVGFWGHLEPLAGMLVGALCAIGLLAALANAVGAFDDFRSAANGSRSWASFADKSLYIGVALLLLATLLINQKSDVIQPYLQSARVIAKNAVLWVMFLATMATSVFFSFDSLFSSIFPLDQRKRSADIRAQRQVAGVVNDIGALAARRQAEEGELLFRAPGWAAYEKNLAALSRASQGAEQEIEKFFVDKMEARRRAVAEQQERMSSAKSGQAGLASRKGALADEISRLKGERPAIAADLAEKKTELENRNKNIDAKRVEVMAEERGAEGTLKIGKGPVFRQRTAELEQLKDAIKIQEERVRDAQKRMSSADTRIAQLERELAAVDGDLAKLKGEAETAGQRIAAAEQNKTGDEDGPKVDPARVRVAFERALAEFRQDPTAERLSTLATQCTQLLGAMISAPATKDRVRIIDCDPKQAAEAAGRVFALNGGLVTYARNCSGGAKLPKTGGVDAMLEFGRQCLQDSGLPSQDAGEMAAKISNIDLNRDDKAHRFVVTWNAFVDGNRLAYLALGIAIAIDSLVFMSGLFGANAIRSPLTEIEHRGERTADQLEAMMDGIIGQTSDPRITVNAILSGLHPVQFSDGFTSEIVLERHDPLFDDIQGVLNMARTIGAVRPQDQQRLRYLLHAGLVQYLGAKLKKLPKPRQQELQRAELIKVVGVALLPDPQANAEIVLSELHPISDAHGFAAEASPFKITDEKRRRLVTNTLGAGATIQGAVRRNNDDGRYFVSTEFYKTLLMMRAAAIPAFRPDVVRARYGLPAPGGMAVGGSDPLPLSSQPVPQIAGPNRADRNADPPQSAAGPSVPVVPAAPARSGVLMPPPLPPGQSVGLHSSNLHPVHETNLADEIRADIIHLGGLHAWSDREITIARTLGADSEPEQALRRLSARAPRLARLVGETIDENRASLREAYDHLRAHNGTDAMYNQVLETVAIELDELMPILMLTPGGPYHQILDRLIYDLEAQAGDGTLSPADDNLLARARGQVAALKSLSDGAADRYVRMVRIIDQYDERGTPAPASFKEAKASQKRSAG